ncbi:putative RNA 2'-phosphotransferase [Azospirillum canadense]|nr:putative RNA 2'-phosphotransferase [Azospirillum canadense]
MALILRHKPETAGLTLDPKGWAPVQDVLEGLGKAGHHLTLEDLRALVAADAKGRYAFSPDEQRIRANQGHSVDVDLGLMPVLPPQWLYHGTIATFLRAIRSQGLIKGKRHHVHLSPDRDTAGAVGRRRGTPIILIVNALAMHEAGHAFYRSANGVWLTDTVPPSYIDFSGTGENDRV